MEKTPQALILGGLFRSRFLLSIIGFLGIIIVFFWLIPKAYRPTEVPPALFAAKPYAVRAQKYLYSSNDPAIILMGSSLVLKPSFESDRQFESLVVPKGENEARAFKQNYTKAEHLRHLLTSRVNGSFDVINIGIPLCMISDYYLILEKLQEFEKNPQVIVLGVAPRDFLDNRYFDPSETPNYKLISACSPVKKWILHPEAMADFMGHFVPPFTWLGSLWDTVTIQAGSYRYAFEASPEGPAHWLADQLKRKLNPPPAAIAQISKKAPPIKANKYFDLDVYNWCYNPANLAQLDRQALFLDKFATLASRRGINVVLVDMPITPENQALIWKGALHSYKEHLHQLANSHDNVMLVDASGSGRYVDQDFVDSVHLNASGGHKCFECIAKAISQNSLLRAKLCSVQRAPQL